MPNNNVYQLDASQLRNQIFGRAPAGTVTAVSVDASGNLGVYITGGVIATQSIFNDSVASVIATTTLWGSSTMYNTSTMSTYTFAMYNRSAASAVAVALEVSPDSNIWTVDTTQQSVAAGAMIALNAQRLLKYTRISYALGGAATTGSVSIDIWLDSQS